MRKINSLLMLVLMICMSVTSAMADKRYSLVDFGDASGAWQEGSIQTDVPCALQNAVTASYDVLSGSSKGTYVDESAVFVFESAGQSSDGTELYRLKNYQSGQYVLDPVTGSTSTISYTDSKARAFVFTVKEAVTYPSDMIEPAEGETQDWTSATTVATALEGAVVLTRSDVTESTALSSVYWLQANGSGKNPTFGHDYTGNAWVIYAVQEMTGTEYCNEVLNEVYPNGRDAIANLYDVGDQPGQISQALYDELLAAYDHLFDLANASTEPSAEECEAAYQRALASIEAAKNGAVPVAEGYYYFRVNQKVDGVAREKNAAYDNGQYIRWSYKTDWELSETPNPADAKYIWHIIPNTKDDRGGYFIQNVYTKRYVGVVKKSDTALPTTVEAEDPWLILPQNGNKNFFTVESVDLIADPVIGWQNTKCTAMHCPNWTDIVVLWTNTDTDGCAWRFNTVSEEMVKAIEESMVQYTLNDALQTSYDEAKASYDGSRVFLAVGEKSTNNLTLDGLVTDASQLSSNAPDKDEGKNIGNLLDANPSTMFHTDWHGEYDVEYHSLTADLSKAVSTLVVKMWRRMNNDWGSIHNGDNNPAPKTFRVSGSNDGSTWTSIGDFSCDWSTTAVFEEKGKSVANGLGYCTITADQAYKQYQLEVIERTNGGTNKFINLGEIRFYEGPIQYTPEASLYEAVPEDVRSAFEASLTKASEELAAEKATQATIDELAKTYETWLANYPDPTQVTKLLAEAQAQAEAADESSDSFGYFQEGAGAALKAALDEIATKVKTVMSISEINAVKAEIQAALDEFNAKLIVPGDGIYVYIQSTSKSTDNNPPTDGYVYAPKNGSAQLKWIANDGSDLGERLNYIWKIEKNEAGKYRFLNMGTGEYMDCPKVVNAKLTSSVAADTCWMSIRSAKVAGSFNFVLDESLFVNAQPGTAKNMVVWNSASGNDNSAFQFIEINSMDGSYIYETTKATQVITLPFDVVARVAEGKLYSVVGQTEDKKVYLQELDSHETIEAGTPFVFIPSDNMEGTSVDFETIASELGDLEFSLEAKTVNGLVGTLAPVSVGAEKGNILGGIIATTTQGETIAANSGYFNAVPQITADQATSVYLEAEGQLTAIHAVNTAEEAELVNVYTLSGVKVRSQVKAANATNSLPAGLYIVGSKKVIVK